MSAYAVIKTGGKQMRAAVDDVIVVEKLAGQPGDVVSFGEVLLHADGKTVKIGAPTLADFTVYGEIEDQRRADKITIIKKRRRQGYRRKKGHRQHETVVRITALGGQAPVAKPRKAKAEAPAKPAQGKAKTGKAETAKAGKAAPEKKSASAGDAPVLFLPAPQGEPDDLKQLTGVGPAIEKKLNAIGVYHYRQIAKFTSADVEKVEEAASLKGRFERDDWIVQAKALSAGKE